MKFLYVPKSGVRRVGQIVWDAENEYVADVKDVELAVTLVTYPSDQFKLVKANKTEIKKLAAKLGVPVAKIEEMLVSDEVEEKAAEEATEEAVGEAAEEVAEEAAEEVANQDEGGQ